jgi:hypothetical protein
LYLRKEKPNRPQQPIEELKRLGFGNELLVSILEQFLGPFFGMAVF